MFGIKGVRRTSQAELVDFLVHRGVLRSPRVQQVMKQVDRRWFINEALSPVNGAYEDHPLPIGQGQTISAPHMHASALELLQEHLVPGARALDVGSGSGYLTACMAKLVGPDGCVLGVEKVPELALRSIRNIKHSCPDLFAPGSPIQSSPDVARSAAPAGPAAETAVTEVGHGTNWRILHGNALTDMLEGEPPFSAIHVGAAADEMPAELVAALAPGGRMVIPVGPRYSYQSLMLVEKGADGSVRSHPLMDVAYVPLTRPSEMEDGYRAG
eukprot:CAMPEP_0202894726 /NCGR_PEP_ID=MMETSP1392-20130828/4062_1 /ASSEMBLY_ACC=CAM_ASM_000868 /TAXON_ID=225041 /ORGANISM="Chlamydomonas chlamydogama, Strain SAG 11-48b" /LENGTH=269 /DNA_ID=CAMNT_0049579497 /DNA_START=101 /DNA_END=910 /DNA_ORIENTATION=+